MAFFIADEMEYPREEDSIMSTVANFIDGAYLQFMLRDEFNSARIDSGQLAKTMAGGREILRTYYYNCLPYQSNPPSPDERTRFSRAQQFNDALQRIPRFEVRLGRLEFRGKKDNGDPIFEQKRVDILLGVDLALLAAKHQITDAAVLAGDSDFLPAIQAAKTEGVVLHLFHGQQPHKDLVQMCDERTKFTREMMKSLLR
ncbi:MAG: NYN domain-containing protein [Planctomycetota bacterium]|nr:NYN domain-containing protein [Planctomycetota bacterium]